jgi:hypothetical protein
MSLAPKQLGLFPVEPCLVLRPRGDGRIEARWLWLDLCTTFSDWDEALARLDDICAFLHVREPWRLLVRKGVS